MKTIGTFGKIPYDITFHSSWWNKNAGISFNERFFNDPEYRIEADIHMRQVLFEKFGEFGIGESNPLPRPIIDSDLIAGEYLQSQMLGCDILFSDADLPHAACAHFTEEQIESLVVNELGEYSCWRDLVSQMNFLEDRYGYVDCHLDLHGVQNLALDLRGEELFIDYFEQREMAEKLLKKCTVLLGNVGSYIKKRSTTLSAGVTSIMKKIDPGIYVTSNCTVEMVSNRLYEDYLLYCDNNLSSRFGEFGVHHCGKSFEHLINGYSKVINLRFLEVGAFSDASAARAAFPNIYINFRVSPVMLKGAVEDTIREALGNILNNGYSEELTSISCVGIDRDTPDINVSTFLKCLNNI